MIGSILKSAAIRWLAVPLAAGLGYGYYSQEHPGTEIAAPAQRQAPQKASVTFTVKSGVTFDSGFTILNDREDFSEDGCQTVVCDGKVLAGKTASDLIGKTITAEGSRRTYKGRPQIRAAKVTVK